MTGPVVAEPGAQTNAQFSPPDGRWLAYQSKESGEWGIYVRPYPAPIEQKSTYISRGVQPRWNADGTELCYLSLDYMIETVPIPRATPAGPVTRLFRVYPRGEPFAENQRHIMSPGKNGCQEFLVDSNKVVSGRVRILRNTAQYWASNSAAK